MSQNPITQIEGPAFSGGLGIGQDFVYLPDVTALRGSNSIEALTTIGLNLKTLILVSIDNQFSAWKLVSGNADGTDPDNQVQPDDYDDTTNNVFWLNIGSFKNGIRGAHVTRSTAQNIPTGVDTAIVFDTARMDTGEWVEDTAPTRFVCDVPGMYAVTGRVSFAPNTTGLRKLYVKKNGGSYVSADIRPANVSGVTVCEVVALVYLMDNDYLELVANQSSGAGLDIQKATDYSPEFACVWLGNPIAEAVSNSSSTVTDGGTTGGGGPSPTVTQTLMITDVGWYRIYEGTVPAVGGFTLQRLDADDGGLVDLDASFAVTGAPDTGVIQVSKNVMNDALQGMDAIRVSYEGTNAFVAVHLNLAGTWTLTRPNRDGYLDAPYVVPLAGSDGSISMNVKPNVTGSTQPIDVPSIQDDGVQFGRRGVANWVAATGTALRTTFDTETATATDVARRLKALVDDALAYGLIRVGLPSGMIYTDMLNLSNSLVSEGTVVNVSDIFRITAAPDASVEGIYVPAGTANGHTFYRLQGYESLSGDVRCVKFNGGTQWEIFGASGVLYRSNAPASPAQPWNTTQWEDTTPTNVTVTTVAPNVAQTFNELSGKHNAVYVTNYPDNPSNNGVYIYTDDFGGKRRYYQQNGANNKRIEWVIGSSLWQLADDVNGIIFFAEEDVTYPDQVTSWTPNTGAGTLTVARMDEADIASGVSISGGGADTDGIYIPQLGIYSNFQTIYRRLDGTRFLNADVNTWYLTDTAGGFDTVYARSDNFGIFPWNAAWTTFSLIAQEKKVAGPTNWHV